MGDDGLKGRFGGVMSEEGCAPRWDRGSRGKLAAGNQVSEGELQPVVGLAFAVTGAHRASGPRSAPSRPGPT